MTTDNLKLWNEVSKTDPAHTKSFSKGGGFKGTAISPMWLIYRATEQWGPMGSAWGVRIISEKIVNGAPIVNDAGAVIGSESIHVVQAEVYHPGGCVPCFGQTTFVGRNKNGIFTDEEAPKKSLTDALTKGLSWLGFAADVHMGLFDDVKYVNDVRGEFTNGKQKKDDKPPATKKPTFYDMAVAALKKVGVSEDQFKMVLKDRGLSAYREDRDRHIVEAMIEEAREAASFNQENIHAGEPI